MKAGWTEVALGDVCLKVKSTNPSKQPELAFEYIDVSSVSRDTKSVAGTTTLLGKDAPSRAKRPVQTDDVLFATIRPMLERVAVIGKQHNGAICSTGYVVLRPSQKVVPRFIYYFLQTTDFLKNMESLQRGASYPAVSNSDVENQIIPLPPLKEQRRIVAVLDDAFASLERARKNVEANLANAGEMLSALVDFEVMNSDETWTNSSIGEVVDIVGGSQPPKSEFVYEASDDLIRLIQIRDYKSDKNIVFIPRDKARRFCEPEDVMIARYGPPIFQILRGLRGAYNVALMKAVPKDVKHLSNEFLFYFLKNRPLLEYVINASSRAAGQSGVNKAGLYPYPIAYPDIEKQAGICERLREHERLSALLVKNYEAQLTDLYSMRQSLLERAFAGELTQASPIIAINDNERDERLSTATLVLAYEKHRLEQRHKTFGTVKAQKTLHLTESVGGLDLGRQPMVRQAGPHDQEHFSRVEVWATRNDVFRFVQRRTGKRGYDFVRGKNYATFLTEAKTLLADYQAGLSRFLPLMTRMNSEEAEIFATVHAAWNNLLAESKTPSDEDIVWAAREGWHESKLDIDRSKFFDAIRRIRHHEIEPDGSAKYVHGAQESLL